MPVVRCAAMVPVTWLGLVTGCLMAGACGRRTEVPVRSRPETTSSRAARLPAPRAAAANALPQDLYAQHCRACHGADGDGRGPAARYLFPKPRNFRSGKFRLVSTARGVATADDLRRVVREGMAGSSMPAFRDVLDEAALEKLVGEVLRLRREGLAAWVRQTALEEFPDEAPTDAEVDEVVEHRVAPGPPVVIPSFGPVTPEMLRQGPTLYSRQDCPRCHGREGAGAEDLYLLDDEGYPTRARDLVSEEFKGGRQPEAIYLRIWLGMPGTPMPAHRSLSASELVALVQSVRALAREPRERGTNYLRAMRAIEHTWSRSQPGAPHAGVDVPNSGPLELWRGMGPAGTCPAAGSVPITEGAEAARPVRLRGAPTIGSARVGPGGPCSRSCPLPDPGARRR